MTAGRCNSDWEGPAQLLPEATFLERWGEEECL